MHLHADAAHHLMCGRKVTVSGESSSMAWLQWSLKQIFNVSWIHHNINGSYCSSPVIFIITTVSFIISFQPVRQNLTS